MSSFTVAGVLDDALYEVQVTDDPKKPVVGSKRVEGLFRQFDGETVLATPQGPAYTVAAGDAKSILALLSAHTKVTRVGGIDGDAPTLVDPRTTSTVR